MSFKLKNGITLREFIRGTFDLENLTPFATAADALEMQAKVRGNSEAMVFPETPARMTYGDWLADSKALARSMIDRGVVAGSHVGVLTESRIEWPVIQIAIGMIGAIMVPLNSHYRRDDLGYVLKQSKIRWLFLSEKFRSNYYLETVLMLFDDLPLLDMLVCIDQVKTSCLDYGALVFEGKKSKTKLPEVEPTSVASLQYTSGTTGFPKGALLTHSGMLGNAWGISGRLGVTHTDRWTSIIPLFHCAGCIMCILGSLQRGCCYVGVSSFDPIKMFQIIEDEDCTMLSGVPTSYLAMLEHSDRSKFDLTTLRAGTCGGADTDPSLLSRCAEKFPIQGIVQVYGQTEASTLISLPDYRVPNRFNTCGKPLPGAEVRFIDTKSGQLCERGMIGEIQTKGPMVMEGYFENRQATAETIDPDGWLRTGDLGYADECGNIVISGGRIRDMIIRGGENVYPVEIENILRNHDKIRDVAVFGLSDPYYGEKVAAAIVIDSDVSLAELNSYCVGQVAHYKIPVVFFKMESFPLTSSGKIRKTEIKDMAIAGALQRL